MASDDAVISVEHVSKDFVLPHEKITSIKSAFTGLTRRGKQREMQHALRDVSFEIKRGEFFGIVGRNGSGKSTMLKMLAGIYQPTKGRVHVRGKLVPFIELGVGFNPELTGRENVFLNGAMLGFSRKEISAMYDDIVNFAELERFMDQKLKNYSSGMQVRLAFSMATRSEADILLVDEVLAVGDADFQRKCFDYFRQLKKNKKTVVFVSHDMDAVREYCDSAILINDGHIAHSGKTDKVAEHYVRLFSNGDSTSAERDRWGAEDAVTKQMVPKITRKSIILEQHITVNRDIDDAIFGFKVRNSAGQHVTGTNSKIEQQKSGRLVKGKDMLVEWEFPNVLSDGTYLVDTAIVGSDGSTVIDWWNEAATFTVKKDRHLPYIIDPDFNLHFLAKKK